MAVHLLDFSAPPNAMSMEAPPSAAAFGNDDGLLAQQHVNHMPSSGGGVLAGDTAPAPPWSQEAVPLSLFNYSTAGASLVGGHHHQPFTAAPAASLSAIGSSHHQVPAASLQLQPFQLIRSSRYLGPAKELLSEFCSLEGVGDFHHAMVDKQRAPPPPLNKAAGNKWEEIEALSSSSGLWGSPSLMSSMDLMELQRRKARLLSMVEEVDRRYRRYREQMRSVEVSLEAVAGGGASQVYTRLARRAMSRHFRCLRDALVAQVRALKKEKGMGGGGGSEMESMAPAGATKGDTPRLRVLDQCLRQQRAFQQPGAIDNYPWRPQRGLPERAVTLLRAWLFEHFLHPYPNDVDKHILARQTGLSRSQVSNWFINARVRLWKPMIEDMYKEEVTQQSEAIVKAERSPRTTLGGESYQQQLPAAGIGNHSNSMISSRSSIVTDGDHDLFHSSYPNLTHGHEGSHRHSAVSLTLGLQQQQQQPFASSSMMMQQRSAGVLLEGHEQSVVPYRRGNPNRN